MPLNKQVGHEFWRQRSDISDWKPRMRPEGVVFFSRPLGDWPFVNAAGALRGARPSGGLHTPGTASLPPTSEQQLVGRDWEAPLHSHSCTEVGAVQSSETAGSCFTPRSVPSHLVLSLTPLLPGTDLLSKFRAGRGWRLRQVDECTLEQRQRAMLGSGKRTGRPCMSCINQRGSSH